MKLEVDNSVAGVVQVILDGALDIAGTEVVDLRLSTIAGKYDRVLVDLDTVSFVASIGIRSLVKAGKTIVRRGGRMVLCRPNPSVQRVLETTGVHQLMLIVGTREDGLKALAVA